MCCVGDVKLLVVSDFPVRWVGLGAGRTDAEDRPIVEREAVWPRRVRTAKLWPHRRGELPVWNVPHPMVAGSVIARGLALRSALASITQDQSCGAIPDGAVPSLLDCVLVGNGQQVLLR